VTRDDDFLSRWSRRKHAANKGLAVPEAPPPLPPGTAANVPSSAGPEAGERESEAPEPLPPVESLTPESDFSPFMRKDVDPGLRRQALKTLFRDPRHNVMDGLDVYIDDFSKPDPIPPEWLGKLNQMARLGDYWATEARLKTEKLAAEAPAGDPIVASNQEVDGPLAIAEEEPAKPPAPPSESQHS
jgi:hypothetical protein